MKIINKDLKIEPGKFGEFSNDQDEFWVSAKIYELTKQMGIQNTIELYSWVLTFPNDAAKLLGWTQEEIERANEEINIYKWPDLSRNVSFGTLFAEKNITALELALRKNHV